MGDKVDAGGGGGGAEQHTSSAINVFVTGQPGVGKSWLVLNAAKKLPKDVIAGFYTVEARNPKTGEKIGVDIETFSGERAPLSRMRRGCGPKVGKYYFALEDFERVALPLLKPTKGIKLHIVDEVGRMELQSERFRDALMALLASPQTAVFGSLRAPRFGHDLPFVEDIKQREDTATLTLTKSNRDATASKVESILMNIVGSASGPVTGRGDQTEALPIADYATNDFDTSKFLNSYSTSAKDEDFEALYWWLAKGDVNQGEYNEALTNCSHAQLNMESTYMMLMWRLAWLASHPCSGDKRYHCLTRLRPN